MMASQLLSLARAYAGHTGLSLTEVGRRACDGNNRIFPRLARDKGCTSKSIEVAVNWFAAHWPAELPVPENIALPPENGCPPPAYPKSRMPKRLAKG